MVICVADHNTIFVLDKWPKCKRKKKKRWWLRLQAIHRLNCMQATRYNLIEIAIGRQQQPTFCMTWHPRTLCAKEPSKILRTIGKVKKKEAKSKTSRFTVPFFPSNTYIYSRSSFSSYFSSVNSILFRSFVYCVVVFRRMPNMWKPCRRRWHFGACRTNDEGDF